MPITYLVETTMNAGFMEAVRGKLEQVPNYKSRHAGFHERRITTKLISTL